MENGDNILAGVKFGFRDERYYPWVSGGRWVECIHWVVSHHHVGRLMVPRGTLDPGKLILSLHEFPNNREYYQDPRHAVQHCQYLEKYPFDELDPLLVVSIAEEWSKKEPFKVVEHPEAAMLSFPS